MDQLLCSQVVCCDISKWIENMDSLNFSEFPKISKFTTFFTQNFFQTFVLTKITALFSYGKHFTSVVFNILIPKILTATTDYRDTRQNFMVTFFLLQMIAFEFCICEYVMNYIQVQRFLMCRRPLKFKRNLYEFKCFCKMNFTF